MRILNVVHRFLPRYPTGTEIYVGTLSRELAARGHAVAIFTGDPEATAPSAYAWEGLPVQAVPWRAGGLAGPAATFLAGFANPPVERAFAEACAVLKPDIVHIHHLLGLSPRLPVLARRAGARVIITLHDFWFQCSNTWLFRYDDTVCAGPGWGYHCGGCALRRLGREPNPALMAATAPIFIARTAALRGVLRQAEVVVAPSQLAARMFASDAALAGKLVVVPHGVGTTTAATVRPQRAEGRPVRYAYVGALIRPKGAHVIIEAFNALPEGDDELHLYGDLEADPAYTEALRRLVTRPGVTFHGQVAHPQVLAALAEIDLLLVPSLWYETYSVNVDEALAAGVPVLVSSHGAAAERVRAEVNGLLAPPGDVAAWRQQMQRVRAEAGLLDQLRAGVRPPQTISAHVDAIEALYGATKQAMP